MDLALVDFDHTVTTCDTYSRFLRRVATPAQLSAAKWTVGPWLLGYRLRLVSAAALRTRVTRLTFAGRDAAEIEAAGECHARNVLPVRMIGEEFVGATATIYLEAAGGQEIRVQKGHDTLSDLPLEIGRELFAYWEPGDGHVIAEG